MLQMSLSARGHIEAYAQGKEREKGLDAFIYPCALRNICNIIGDAPAEATSATPATGAAPPDEKPPGLSRGCRPRKTGDAAQQVPARRLRRSRPRQHL
jgi:hypothetical protein